MLTAKSDLPKGNTGSNNNLTEVLLFFFLCDPKLCLELSWIIIVSDAITV